MRKLTWAAAAMVAATFAFAGIADAETRVTYKSAKSTSSYYQMAVQLAEAIKQGSGGDIILTVEESQGSVQNVKEAAIRTGNYVFTTPPALVKLAQSGQKMFEPKDDKFDEIRGLFPIPSLTMHFVVRKDAGIDSFSDLEGKTFLIGKGSFGADEAEKYLKLFGLEGKVNLAEVELNAAVSALKNRQIDGFATAGSYPAPNVLEAAATTEINLLSLSDEQIAETKRDKLVIPGGTLCRRRRGRQHHHPAGHGLHHHQHGRRHRLCADQNLLGEQVGDGGSRQVVERRDARLSRQHGRQAPSGRFEVLRREGNPGA
jgi:uncharacterized protein